MSAILVYATTLNELDILIPAVTKFAVQLEINEIDLLYVESDDFDTSSVRVKINESNKKKLNFDITEIPYLNCEQSLGAFIDRNKHKLLLGIFNGAYQKEALNFPVFTESTIDTILLWPRVRTSIERVGVAASGGHNDSQALKLAESLLGPGDFIPLLMMEEDFSFNYETVGKKAVAELIEESSVNGDKIKVRVENIDSDYESLSYVFSKVDFVLSGSENAEAISKWHIEKRFPMVGLVKRAPKMAFVKKVNHWIPHLSPSAYADLVLGLRRGSVLTSDFMVMLGLAAAIASFGLLQDSAAIVIGSMLLAPLMTPMIGCGLALVQGNSRLGLQASRTIGIGVLLTIIVSFVVGFITPGQDLTSEVMARGVPNILDLFVALFAACAAAYALARPNIAGAVAGVAIATALVPPLCSTGIALAYGKVATGLGAFLLFSTNLVAIILGASITFNVLGINSMQMQSRRNTWVYKAMGSLAGVLVIFAVPLGLELERNIKLGKPTPNLYPVASHVTEAIVEYIEKLDDVELLLHGRPGSPSDPTDVMIILASKQRMSHRYEDELKSIVRKELNDYNLKVEVHALRDGWLDLELKRQADQLLQERDAKLKEKIEKKLEQEVEKQVHQQVQESLNQEVDKQIEKKLEKELDDKIEEQVENTVDEELKSKLRKPLKK